MSRLDQALSHEIFCIDSYWTETARSWCVLDFRDFLVYISTWGICYVCGTFSPSSRDTSYWVPCKRVGQCDQHFYSLGVANLQEELLSGFLPSWLNLIFSHDFGWHSFTTELLDYLQLESRSTFAGADMGALKAMHQKKEWWWPRLCMCIEGCTDKTVLKFAKKAWTNLLNNRLTTSMQVKDSTLERVSHFSRECHVTILHDSYLGSQLHTHSCWQNRVLFNAAR
jgi:hypothetical protein